MLWCALALLSVAGDQDGETGADHWQCSKGHRIFRVSCSSSKTINTGDRRKDGIFGRKGNEMMCSSGVRQLRSFPVTELERAEHSQHL